MGATASTILKLRLMDGSETDWGTKNNTNFGMVENAIAGTTSVSTTGGTTTLTNVDYTDDQSKKAVLDVTGALTTNAIIEIPNASRLYRIFNRTTEAGSSTTLTIKTSGGSGLVIPRSTVSTVYCNGSNTMRFVTPISDYTTGAPATSSGAAASSVSVTPSGNLAASNVQSALSELQGDVDSINAALPLGYQPLNANLTDIAAIGLSKGNIVVTNGTDVTSLAVGTNGFAMIADSSSATGMKWAALIPAGTKTIFYASSVNGWTLDTDIDNYAIRISSSGTGAAVSGTAFTSIFTSRTIAQANLPNYTLSHTLATAGAGAHDHIVTQRYYAQTEGGAGSVQTFVRQAGVFTSTDSKNTSTEPNHTHTLTGSVTSGGSGTAMDFAVAHLVFGKFTKSAY